MTCKLASPLCGSCGGSDDIVDSYAHVFAYPHFIGGSPAVHKLKCFDRMVGAIRQLAHQCWVMAEQVRQHMDKHYAYRKEFRSFPNRCRHAHPRFRMPSPALTISAANGMFWFLVLYLLSAPVIGAVAFGLISFTGAAIVLGAMQR